MALKLSRKGDYGLLLATRLGRSYGRGGGEYISLRKVAKEKNLPYKFLSQVAGELKRAGILESREGVGGGYRLAKSPEEVLVREVLDALEGPMEASECGREEKCDCGGSCVHEAVEERLVEGASRALAMFSIAELLRDLK